MHRPGTGCEASGGETIHHLQLKTSLVRALVAQSWDASTEVAGDGWRADVLTTHGEERVAFEVQWSAQEIAETLERSRRYADSGVRVVWLMRRVPHGVVARRDVPCFEVRVTNDAYRVAVGGRLLSIAELVDAYLTGSIRPVPARLASSQIVYAVTIEIDCESCGERAVTALGFPHSAPATVCGMHIAERHWALADILVDAKDQVVTLLRQGHLTLPGIIPRSGFHRLGVAWRSFCRSCGTEATNANNPSLFEATVKAAATKPQVVYTYSAPLDSDEQSNNTHWCTLDGCAEQPADAGADALADAVASTTRDAHVTTLHNPAVLAGTSSADVVRMPTARWAVICQGDDLTEMEARVQRARLGDIGWSAAWLTTGAVGDVQMIGPVPAMSICNSDSSHVAFESTELIPAFVLRLLAGGPVQAPSYRLADSQLMDVYEWAEPCWRCRHEYTIIGIVGVWRSRCGKPLEAMALGDPEIGEAVATALQDGCLTSSATVAWRFATTVQKFYWANFCPRCSARYGDSYHRRAMTRLRAQRVPPNHTLTFPPPEPSKPRGNQHWCMTDPSCCPDRTNQ